MDSGQQEDPKYRDYTVNHLLFEASKVEELEKSHIRCVHKPIIMN